MRRKRIIGVDLIPLRADGSNGGVKHAIIEFLVWIQNNKTDEIQFVYFCNSHTQHEIRNFSRADDVTVCLLALDGVEPVSQHLLTQHDFNAIGQQGSILLDFPVDLIYAPLGNTDLRYPGTPTIATVLDLLHKDYPDSITIGEAHHRDRFFKDMILRSELIQVISNYTKERLIHHYNVSENQVFVNYLPIHHRLSKSPLNKGPLIDGPYFFYPANFWRHKNHDTLLVAYYNYIEKVGSRPWKLVFTGHDSERKGQVKDHAVALGLTEHVVFLDYLNHESLENYWHNAYALVFPSLHEGFGIPLLEAMHYEVPIICHNGTALSEIGNGASLFCDCRNPLSLASAMTTISQSSDARSNLIAQGKTKLSDFNFEEIADNLAGNLIECSQNHSTYLSHYGIYEDGWISKKAAFNLPESTERSRFEIQIFPIHEKRFIYIYLNDVPYGSYDLSLNEENLISFYAFQDGGVLKIESSETSRLSTSDPRNFGVRIQSINLSSAPNKTTSLWATE